MTTATLQILSKFDMTATGCLVMVSDMARSDNPSELLSLAEAESFGATAVYFRRKHDGNQSIPQIYIFDKDFTEERELENTHKDLWSSGVVPLFYLVSDTSLKIYNCHKSLERKGKNNEFVSKPIKIFDFESDAIEQYEIAKYSSRLFDTGVFWEQNSKLIHFKNSPYDKLLKGLENAKKHLAKQDIGLSDFTINKLLIIGILLRYLEEKEDEHGTKLLEVNRDLIDQFPNSSNFVDILRNGQLVQYLKELNKTLNGNLFNLTDDEANQLQDTNLDLVAAIFDGTVDNNQFVLWKLYSFNKLPIELISSVYEAFLTKDKSIVYTPPYLANTLIDECMPLYKYHEYFSDSSFKVLDPACGSGIFLVSAFKRMVEWSALNTYKQTGKLMFPDITKVKEILRNNIFGVDINRGATLISMFSLNITLCEKLTPIQVWQELKFEDLSVSNIATDNFFSYYNNSEKESFDLVIGNPPFNPPNGDNGKPISNGKYLSSIVNDFDHETSTDINDHNLALIFHDKVRDLIKENGQQCLILPSGPFLYNTKSIDYRTRFFTENKVSKIFDFTHLSDKIFVGANVAVAAVYSIKRDPNNLYSFEHIVVKRSSVAEERFYFEIDHYDIHDLKSNQVFDYPYIFKVNLLGGGRILNLLRYVLKFDTLKEYLESKKDQGWQYGVGFIIGHDGSKSNDWLKENGYSKADYLTGKNYIVTDSFTIEDYSTEVLKTSYFKRPKKKIKIYKPPHILFKENLGNDGLLVHFSEEYVAFKAKITGIHAPEKDKSLLIKVYNWLKNNPDLLRFIISVTSTQAGVTLSSKVLLSKDILALPFPEEGEITLSKSEKLIIKEVLKYGIKSKQTISHSPYEKIVVDSDLKLFGELFCEALNPIYANDQNQWCVHSFSIRDEYTSFAFYYGNKENWTKDILDLTSKETYTKFLVSNKDHVKYTRVLRKYLHIDGFDILVLTKPSTIRYWLGSIALRDADETFSDLKQIGK